MKQKPEWQQSSNDSAERLLVLFRAIQKNYKDFIFGKSKQFGLTGPQLGLVFALHKKPFTTLQELSEHIGLSKSTVSGMVDRLVQQGIVKREIPEENRRIVRLSLSKEFMERNDLIDVKNKFISDIIKNAAPEDLEVILKGLEKLYELMKKQ